MKRDKLIRLRDGHPLRSIAPRIGITPQMLSAIERGARTPSLHLAKRIADFYHCSVDELFFDWTRPRELDGKGGTANDDCRYGTLLDDHDDGTSNADSALLPGSEEKEGRPQQTKSVR
jgi:putative transcriptional regulator